LRLEEQAEQETRKKEATSRANFERAVRHIPEDGTLRKCQFVSLDMAAFMRKY
jgi:hypothetical protein